MRLDPLLRVALDRAESWCDPEHLEQISKNDNVPMIRLRQHDCSPLVELSVEGEEPPQERSPQLRREAEHPVGDSADALVARPVSELQSQKVYHGLAVGLIIHVTSLLEFQPELLATDH